MCLDTNAVIAAINNRPPDVRRRLTASLADGVNIGVSTIVLFELWYGIRKSARPRENTEILAAFLALGVTPWPFDPEDADEAGALRRELEGRGEPIGPYDVLIAAQARRRSALLVTANTREFERIPGLTVADWTRP
jgi:tRNA(fMet)-specific endonuclease VapC